MRVLFTFIAGNGHFQPLVPIAQSAVAAGHAVAIAGGGSMVKAIETAGFHAFATEAAGDGVRPRLPLLEPDQGCRAGVEGALRSVRRTQACCRDIRAGS